MYTLLNIYRKGWLKTWKVHWGKSEAIKMIIKNMCTSVLVINFLKILSLWPSVNVCKIIIWWRGVRGGKDIMGSSSVKVVPAGSKKTCSIWMCVILSTIYLYYNLFIRVMILWRCSSVSDNFWKNLTSQRLCIL